MTRKKLSALDPMTHPRPEKSQITLRVPKIVKDRIIKLSEQEGAALNSYVLHILISFLAKKRIPNKH